MTGKKDTEIGTYMSFSRYTLQWLRLRPRCERRVALWIRACTVIVCLPIGTSVLGQPAPIPTQNVAVLIDSGLVSASVGGSNPVVVFSQVITVEGAPWVRLYFREVQLGATAVGSNKAFIRITSLEDGAEQSLDSNTLARWRNSSAYFNGEHVLVELLSFPKTTASRIVIDRIEAGIQNGGGAGCSGSCGDVDDRVFSDDPRAGRVMPIGCTAFLFNGQANGLITAGHCCAGVIAAADTV